jgi:cbb3-type cytochrome oxidase subunit 1
MVREGYAEVRYCIFHLLSLIVVSGVDEVIWDTVNVKMGVYASSSLDIPNLNAIKFTFRKELRGLHFSKIYGPATIIT